MKILIVSECYPTIESPQYGVFIKQQAVELEKLGYSIDVVIPERCSSNGELQSFDGYYKIKYSPDRYELFPTRSCRLFYSQVIQLIKNNIYDIVAVHITSDTILSLTVKACQKLKVPIVAHYHGLNVWKEFVSIHRCREKLYARRRKRILKRVQAIVGVSQKVTDIIKSKLPNSNAQTVYNGVDCDLFKPTDKAQNNTINVIGVGNLIAIKGFDYLIKAFAKINKQYKNTFLHIVGQGVMGPELVKLVEQRSLTDVVKFYGKLPYEEVSKKIQQSDLFVLPSYYEALGCVYLEAMACGVPAIGVKGMGIDEIIVDGENGYLVNPCDVEDLYEKMSLAINNLDKLNEMSLKALETAKKYTWENSARCLDLVFQALIK